MAYFRYNTKYKISSLRTAMVHIMSYLLEKTHLRKDAAFSHFCLKENSENIIFLLTENIRKLRKYDILCSFHKVS